MGSGLPLSSFWLTVTSYQQTLHEKFVLCAAVHAHPATHTCTHTHTRTRTHTHTHLQSSSFVSASSSSLLSSTITAVSSLCPGRERGNRARRYRGREREGRHTFSGTWFRFNRIASCTTSGVVDTQASVRVTRGL